MHEPSLLSRSPFRVLCAFAVSLVVALASAAQSVEAQGVISGTAEDARTGLPVGSVQISITNLDIGVLSAASGVYQLPNVPPGSHTVTAQRLGYQTVTVEVTVAAGQTAVADFQLDQAALQLDEVIVTGTAGGTQRRAIGNVVERMDAAAITDMAPVVSVEQLLSTRVPGLAMMSAGGFVGAGEASIRIRGSSSPGLPNDPLVYVDGVRMNADRAEGRRQTTGRLNDINPEDIASIEVIKGPAASTLYGTEASNGVIQIITKRGETGETTFDATVGLGLNYMTDPHGKIWTNYDRTPSGDLLQMHMLDAYKARTGDDLFRYGALQEYSLSARGGTDLFRYFASFNRNDQDGIVSWNWDQRTTGRVNLDITASDMVTIGLNGSMMSGQTRLVGDLWRQTMSGTPLSAVDYGGQESILMGWGGRTPAGLRDGQEWLFDTERKNTSVQVNFQPFEWFQNRLTAGIDLTDQRETNTIFREADAPNGIWGGTGRGRRRITGIETQLKSLDYSGTASFDLTDQLGSATSVGFQYYQKKTWENFSEGEEFATEFLSTVGAAARTEADEDRLENVTAGAYVQQVFDWEDRIFLTGAVRFDENSAFGVDYGAQTYPKVSATWVMSESSFWNVDFLNPLRLRGAWGAAGRQPDVFAAQRLYSPETGPGGSPILTPSSFGNANLGPERAEEIEIGFDAGLMDERIQLGFTAYWKSTKDAIVDAPVLPSLGFPGRQFVNAGQVDNWGTELTLDLQLLQEDPLRWDLALAFATMDNEIVDLGDIERITIRRSREHIVGYPLAGLHSFKVVSADFVPGSTTQVTDVMCDAGTGADGRQQGGPAVLCADANRVFFGPSHHTWQINATSTWTLFENIRLFATVEGRGGGIQHSDQIGARHTSWHNSFAVNVADPDPVFRGQIATQRDATGYIPNGYLNFDELGVQYQLPPDLVATLGATRASIGLSVRNLGFLWREEWNTTIGGERIHDVRQSLGNQEFPGQQDTQAPISSTALLRMRVTF